MMHTRRAHTRQPVATFEALAAILQNPSGQCLCAGFECEGVLFLNDSITSDPDRFWEYAVVKDGVQVESLTVNVTGMTAARLVKALRRAAAIDPRGDTQVQLRVHPVGVCGHCA